MIMSNYSKEGKMNHQLELKIEDRIIGDGKEIQKGALVFVHYEGTLDDGTKFESTFDKGIVFKFVFGTGRVIKGWDLGLVGMKCGGQRKLFIPAHLAYGDRQIGVMIKPHSNLHFNIHLIDVLTRDD
jgi:peptidylprolyl isomerase